LSPRGFLVYLGVGCGGCCGGWWRGLTTFLFRFSRRIVMSVAGRGAYTARTSSPCMSASLRTSFLSQNGSTEAYSHAYGQSVSIITSTKRTDTSRSIITKYATIGPCRHATLVTAQVQQTTRSRLLASQAASSTFANHTWIKLRPVHTRTWSIRKSRNWSCGRNHNLRGRDLHPAHLVQMHHLTLTTSTPSWVLVRRCCLRFLLLLMVRVIAR
jgi:hypothetical protein